MRHSPSKLLLESESQMRPKLRFDANIYRKEFNNIHNVMVYRISLHHRTLWTCSLSNQTLQKFQVPLNHPHGPWVYKSTQFNLLNLVYEVVFLCIEKIRRYIILHLTLYMRNLSPPILYIFLMDLFRWQPSTCHARKSQDLTKISIIVHNN